MSKTKYSRVRRAISKATANYKSKPSRRNWKRFSRALSRYSNF